MFGLCVWVCVLVYEFECVWVRLNMFVCVCVWAVAPLSCVQYKNKHKYPVSPSYKQYKFSTPIQSFSA